VKNLFYQPIKIKCPDDKFFVWSDLHIGHDPKWENPLWKMRGFNSIYEHDETLIFRWNETIDNNSTVVHCGDIMFGKDGYDRLKKLLDILNFHTLYLLPGNHMAGWKQIFESIIGSVYITKINKTVIFCPNYLETFVNHQPIVFSHYPISSWNGMGGGSWMIFGHCHGTFTQDLGKALCVDVESQSYPVSYLRLQELMAGKTLKYVDHHGPHIQNPF